MEKELEALEILDYHNDLKKCWSKEFDIIEQALQRLEAIDNANPNKALECLDKINNYLNDVYDYKEIKEEIRKDIATIKQALIKSQKDEKIILGIEDYINQRISIEPIEDVKKAFIEIRNQLQIIKEVVR